MSKGLLGVGEALTSFLREKEEEARARRKERDAERRRNQIERTLLSTGVQVLKRGLFKTLFK